MFFFMSPSHLLWADDVRRLRNVQNVRPMRDLAAGSL
jgi:hypothetical protein